MRLATAALACSLIPAVAARASGGPPSEVIGGADAKAGKWPDVAAILFPDGNLDEALCTGTLIAPNVVITAGHCYDPTEPLPDNVLIGTSSLASPGDGETIAIARGIVYPDADNTEDVAVLVLAQPATRAPRAIATGWAAADIANGAAVALVGYGATNSAGDHFIDALQEASSTITDFNCSVSPGCNTAAQPAGELGAGGKGVDTCPGDSGGPLYLTTAYGAFLAGVTSRSYDNAHVSCSDGGIYERPDKFIDWIQDVTQATVTRGPEPAADPIVGVPGDAGDTQIDVNDPGGSSHKFAITAQPALGMAKVRSDGAIRMCIDPDAAPGDDSLTVRISDAKHSARSVTMTIPIHVQAGAPATAVPCDLAAFADDGGCCDAGSAPRGALPIALGVLALVRRRRRC
jgi:secreted trypsin-like serine protease